MKTALKICSFLTALILTVILIKKAVPLITDDAQIKVLVSETLFACTVFVWFIVFVKLWDRERLRDSALFPESSIVFFLSWGLTFGFCLIFITYAVSRSTGALIAAYHPLEGIGPGKFIVISVLSTAFAAFWEELAFRGFLLKKLMAGVGRHKACLIVALIFGLLHLLSPVKSVNIVISTIFSGLLLNYAFLYSENLYFPMGIHFSWNFFLGKIFYSKHLFEFEFVNKFWAGHKNPEEGVIAITITAVGFLTILLLRKTLKSMASSDGLSQKR